MTKLTVEQFRLVRKKLDDITNYYLELIDTNKDKPDYDEGKIINDFAEDYQTVVRDLVNYDLSDIPFEEWKHFKILPTERIDFSKTKANIDFSLIEYEAGYGYFGGCNVKIFIRF